MRLLLMGPPGSGKGTQTIRLANRLRVLAISTGDIFRANLRARTHLGQLAESYMERGAFVPDAITDAMVHRRLTEPDCSSGFILDGYPRTLAQVGTLDIILAELDSQLDGVIALQVGTEDLISRLRKRAQIEGRPDDTETVIRHRQALYADQTAPLLAIYQDRGQLIVVPGRGNIVEVGIRVGAAVKVFASRNDAGLRRTQSSLGY